MILLRKLKHMLRLTYLITRTRIQNIYLKAPKVIDDIETLHLIRDQGCSVARFGDGEIALVHGDHIKFQTFDSEIQSRLCEVLESDDKNILICIPNIFTLKSLCHLTYESKVFWLNELIIHKHIWYSLPKQNKVYYDACITRPYIRNQDKTHSALLFKLLKEVWNQRDVILIEGKYSRLGVGNDLFQGCNSLRRILCPPEHAYTKYNEILSASTQIPKDSLILISLGPTATILAYDLHQLGYQAFDLGHIDLEYEWFLKKADHRIPIKNKAVNELNEQNIEKQFHDKVYEASIIQTIE